MKPNIFLNIIVLNILFSVYVFSQTPEELLLKDFKPVSIYNIPMSTIDKPCMPVFDAHSHAYAKTPEEVKQWVETMNYMGIEKTIILSGATGKAFDETMALYGKYTDKFIIWCGLDFSNSDEAGWSDRAIKELERCYGLGAKGVGEITDKGTGLYSAFHSKSNGLRLNDPEMGKVLKRMAELNMPMNIHIAEPIWMYEEMTASNDGLMNGWTWRIDKNVPGILLHHELIDVFEKAVAINPQTTFIACHFLNCSYDLSILGNLLEKYPNLHCDISARYAETAPIPRYMLQFYNKYQDKILYGTDMGFDPSMYRITFRVLESSDEHFYESDQFGYHWAMNGFALPKSILKKVYLSNAKKLFNTK